MSLVRQLIYTFQKHPYESANLLDLNPPYQANLEQVCSIGLLFNTSRVSSDGNKREGNSLLELD